MCDSYDVARLLDNGPGGHLSAAILLLALHNCRGGHRSAAILLLRLDKCPCGHRSASILLLALHGLCPSMHVDDSTYIGSVYRAELCFRASAEQAKPVRYFAVQKLRRPRFELSIVSHGPRYGHPKERATDSQRICTHIQQVKTPRHHRAAAAPPRRRASRGRPRRATPGHRTRPRGRPRPAGPRRPGRPGRRPRLLK